MSWFTNKQFNHICNQQTQNSVHLQENINLLDAKLNLILKNQEKIIEMLTRKHKKDMKSK